MADNNDSSWKEALKSKDAFADFITDYFKKNKELTDSYRYSIILRALYCSSGQS